MGDLIKTNIDHLIFSDVILRLFVVLVTAAILGAYVRALYLRFSRSLSNRDDFSGVFLALTVTTVLVITVIKSSLALSLGLVGALSIVRFRAAIKDPEELIYLFFCIALGLALGAELIFEAFAGALVFTTVVIWMHYRRGRSRHQQLMLTISGPACDVLAENGETLQRILKEVIGETEVQRLECDGDDVQFRATIMPEFNGSVFTMVACLKSRLPGCQVSFVNLELLV